MKRLILITLSVLLACSSVSAQSILRNLERRARNAASNAVSRQVDKAVDQAVDNAIEKQREKQQAELDKAAGEYRANMDSLSKSGVEVDLDEAQEAVDKSAEAVPQQLKPADPEGIAYAKKHGTWFCAEPGTVLYYETRDASGKQTNAFQYKIKDVKTEGDKTVIFYDTLIPALSDEPTGCNVRSEGGWFYTDAAGAMGQTADKLSVTGNAPILPEKPGKGVKLDDCTVNIASMATTANYTDIRFTGNDTVTTAAGSFDCWCLEFTTVTKMAFIKASNLNEQWFAKGIGVVKYVIKDKKGNVQSTQELVKIEKP